MEPKEQTSLSEGPKDVNDLRDVLMDDIRRLRAGETTAANVNAVCNAVGKVLSTVKLQMEYAKLTGRTPEIPLLHAKTKASRSK